MPTAASKAATPPRPRYLGPAEEGRFAIRLPSLAAGGGRCPFTGAPVDADPRRLAVTELDGAALSDAAARKYAPTLASLADEIDPAWRVEADGVSAAVMGVALKRGEYECGFLHRTVPTAEIVAWQPLAIAALPAGGDFMPLSHVGAEMLCPDLLALVDAWYGSAPRRIDATGGHADNSDAARHERARRRAYWTARAQLDATYHALPGRRHGEKHSKRVADALGSIAVLRADDRVSRPTAPPTYGIAST